MADYDCSFILTGAATEGHTGLQEPMEEVCNPLETHSEVNEGMSVHMGVLTVTSTPITLAIQHKSTI